MSCNCAWCKAVEASGLDNKQVIDIVRPMENLLLLFGVKDGLQACLVLLTLASSIAFRCAQDNNEAGKDYLLILEANHKWLKENMENANLLAGKFEGMVH